MTGTQRPICILSVGRSGTSLIARAVNLLGADLGPEETMLEASDLNPKGFWEQREIMELNDDILDALGGTWWQPPPRPPGWEHSAEMEAFRVRIAQLVERMFGGSERWAFKDPRLTLTLPLWREVVGEFDYVISVRNPVEVAESLADGLPPGHDTYGLWLHYNCEAVRLTSSARRTFVFYDDWFDAPGDTARRLAGFVQGSSGQVANHGRRAVEDFFDPRLRRRRSDETALMRRADVPVRCRALYAVLRALDGQERDGGRGAEALQALAANMDDAGPDGISAICQVRLTSELNHVRAERDALRAERDWLVEQRDAVQAAHDWHVEHLRTVQEAHDWLVREREELLAQLAAAHATEGRS